MLVRFRNCACLAVFFTALFAFEQPLAGDFARISASDHGRDATPQASSCALQRGPTLSVAAVLDGETLVLDGGTEVRLIGAMTPRAPIRRDTPQSRRRTTASGLSAPDTPPADTARPSGPFAAAVLPWFAGGLARVATLAGARPDTGDQRASRTSASELSADTRGGSRAITRDHSEKPLSALTRTARHAPLERQAHDLAERLVLGRSVTLWMPHDARRNGRAEHVHKRRAAPLAAFRRDRYGRVLAHVTVSGAHLAGAAGGVSHDESYDGRAQAEKPIWVQAAMLRLGLARSYSTRDVRTCAHDLQRHEAVAREREIGVWRHARYRLRDARAPSDLEPYLHTFQVVEGRVRRVARYRNTTYINFGGDWRTDFTVMVEGRAHRTLKGMGLDVAQLDGQRIQVRGWLETRDGPMIRLTHAEQIRILEPGVSDHLAAGALDDFDALRDRAAALTDGSRPAGQRRSLRARSRANGRATQPSVSRGLSSPSGHDHRARPERRPQPLRLSM